MSCSWFYRLLVFRWFLVHYAPLHVACILLVSGSKPQYKGPAQQKPAASGDASQNRQQPKPKPFQQPAGGQQSKKRPAQQQQNAGAPAKKKKQGGKATSQPAQQSR